MIILSVSHHIHLNKEQRYSLVDKNTINTMGVSIPVWINDDDGKPTESSEPAVEVFCNYELTNKEKRIPIQFKKNGYSINLPQLSEHDKAVSSPVSNEIWRSFGKEERAEYYKNQPIRTHAGWLKDIEEGGSMHIQFREHNKIYQDKEFLEVYHYVHINDISMLTRSLQL